MELMEAWRLVQPSNAVLLVAGPDMVGHPWDVGPAAREYVEQHGLGGSVRFLGSIADVASLLRVADVVRAAVAFRGARPVRGRGAGVRRAGRRVGVGGLLEFIVDGENGKLCPPKAPPALAACLRTLIEDAALREQLSAKARPSVVSEYDERVVFSRFASLLRQLAQPL